MRWTTFECARCHTVLGTAADEGDAAEQSVKANSKIDDKGRLVCNRCFLLGSVHAEE